VLVIFLLFCVVLFVFVSSFRVLSLMLPVSLPTEKCCTLYISLPIGHGHHDIESPDRSAALNTHLNQLVEVIMIYREPRDKCCPLYIPVPVSQGHNDIVIPDRSAALYTYLYQLTYREPGDKCFPLYIPVPVGQGHHDI